MHTPSIVPHIASVLIVGAFLVAIAPFPAGAVSIPLESIPARVREANPSLSAARFRIEEARGRLQSAGRLPNPDAGFEFAPNMRGREVTVGISFEQRFPLTARLRLEKAVSAAELTKAEDEILDIERHTIAAAEEAGIRWLAVTMLTELRARQATNAGEQADFLEQRASVGEGSSLDAGQSRLEAARLSHEARQIDAQRLALDGELRALLGISDREPITITGRLEAPQGGSSRAIRSGDFDAARRPDLRALLHEQRAADHSLALERARRWDDIAVQAFVEIERAEDVPDGLETDRFIGLGFTIPLPWWNRNEGAVQEARARAARARGESTALEAAIRNDVGTARAEMEMQARLAAESSDTLLRLGEDQLKRIEEAYTSGQAPLTDVLRARDQLLDIRHARIEALRDYHLARVRFESATARHSAPPSSATPRK